MVLSLISNTIMQARAKSSAEILSVNLKKLMDMPKSPAKSQLGLAKKSGVAQATIGRILKQQTQAGTDTLDSIAHVYNLTAWQLILPDLDPANPQVLRPVSTEEEALYARLRQAAQDVAQYTSK